MLWVASAYVILAPGKEIFYTLLLLGIAVCVLIVLICLTYRERI
jgi:hypothetical protein